jgi:hypothetical protein
VVVDNAGYYRAVQDVPVGITITDTEYWFPFVPTLLTKVFLNQTVNSGDGIALVAMGYTTPEQYSWSTPQVQYVVADATLAANRTIVLDNNMGGTNVANLIVTKGGLRLRPPACIEWIGDDSSVSFGLPQRMGFNQDIINAPTDIQVWVDNVLQEQSFGPVVGSYSVTTWTGSNTPGRQVIFTTPPAAGARILISVSTVSDYEIVGNELQITALVNINDVIAITSWNDTAQQQLLTILWQGPVTTGVTVEEPYDSTAYDLATVSFTPGAYDYTAGTSVSTNEFYLQRDDIVASRLWVTLDGERLFEGIDYTVENGYLILASGAIKSNQVVVVTETTNSIVPESMGFRIFQDMRGVQATYRITSTTSTVLTQDLSATDDIIYVEDAHTLGDPNLAIGIFGVVTINGERIMYRERNTALNTVSGLRRGTAGTAAADHSAGDPVYDMGRGNLMATEYQDYIVSDSSIGDGTTSVFYAPSIEFEDFEDSSTENKAIEVYVGGIRQYAYSDTSAESQYRWFVTDFDPLAIDFVVDDTVYPPLTAPAANVEVTILVRRGVTWYQQGVGTASDGVALQDTNTVPARFLRGL